MSHSSLDSPELAATLAIFGIAWKVRKRWAAGLPDPMQSVMDILKAQGQFVENRPALATGNNSGAAIGRIITCPNRFGAPLQP
jgi:hypothetical protein